MLSALRDRLQTLWMQNTRNRVVIMVSTAVLAVLLLCGCLNLLGAIGGGLVDSLVSSGPPERPTIPAGTQVANINPTFPLPKPTVNPYPNPPAQNVPSSNTPQPSPTPSPTPTQGPHPPGGRIHFQLSPDPNGQAFVAGVDNTIMLSNGQPGTPVSVSVFFDQSPCVGMQGTLDDAGQASFTCAIPANLAGSQVQMEIDTLFNKRQETVPVIASLP